MKNALKSHSVFIHDFKDVKTLRRYVPCIATCKLLLLTCVDPLGSALWKKLMWPCLRSSAPLLAPIQPKNLQPTSQQFIEFQRNVNLIDFNHLRIVLLIDFHYCHHKLMSFGNLKILGAST